MHFPVQPTGPTPVFRPPRGRGHRRGLALPDHLGRDSVERDEGQVLGALHGAGLPRAALPPARGRSIGNAEVRLHCGSRSPHNTSRASVFTWGVDNVTRFDDKGARLVRPRKNTRRRGLRAPAGTRGVRHGGWKRAREGQGESSLFDVFPKINSRIDSIGDTLGQSQSLTTALGEAESTQRSLLFGTFHKFSVRCNHFRCFLLRSSRTLRVFSDAFVT